MTLKEFGETIEFNIEHNLKHAVLGLGAPGVGKSELIRQIGEKYGYKVIDVRLAQMSEVEIGGLIYPNEERTKTKWLAPEILPDVARDGEKTILLLDEITSCNKRVQVAAYQLILDRRVGQYALPDGTFVIALGNREDDDGVFIKLASPLADRFEIHNIEVDVDSWIEYATNNDVYPTIINYIMYKPDALHTQDPDSDEMVFATPRSWVRVSNILKIDDNLENAVIRRKIEGNIGEVEALQFFDYCKKHKDLVTCDEFLAGTKAAPTAADELNILVRSLAGKLSFLEKKNEYKTASDLSVEQRGEAEKVIAALFTIKKSEFVIVGIKKLLDMNRGVVKEIILDMDNPNIIKFIHDNRVALGINDIGSAVGPGHIAQPGAGSSGNAGNAGNSGNNGNTGAGNNGGSGGFFGGLFSGMKF